MFKGHPKGLFIAFFANMGERFGFYTMISIFVLFLQAKYGLNATAASFIYSIFMFGVYFFPLLGGFLADRFLGYGKTISLGLIVMLVGYVLITIPSALGSKFWLIIVALAVIAPGTGLFSGRRLLRLPEQDRKGALHPAQNRFRHADHGGRLRHPRPGLAGAGQSESAGGTCRAAEIQRADAGRMVRRHGDREQPGRCRRLFLAAGAALGSLVDPGHLLPAFGRLHVPGHETAGAGRSSIGRPSAGFEVG